MEKYLIKPGHPTGSLDFLKKLRESRRKNRPTKARIQLRVAIVGAGLGGLATGLALAQSGHDVTLYEQAPELGEVGAGIQVSPNSSRHLMRWGVEKYLAGMTVEPTEIQTRRWQNGKMVARVRLVPQMRETYGAPYLQIHRADFHAAMKQAALDSGVTIKLNSKVIDYDFDKPTLTIESGEVIDADLIVAADGIDSIARNKFLAGKDLAGSVTGFAAYRGTLDARVVRNVPELKWLVEKPTQNIWIGHGRHIITYTLKSGELFNFVLLHPEKRDPSEWKESEFMDQMMENYGTWDPVAVKLLSLIENPTKWPISISSPLKKWAADSGKFVIIGDAAHAMVPWMAQGAAMAVEDAAALEEILKLVPSKELLREALEVYESVRIPRTRMMQQASLLNGFLYHMPDGPEQRARDEASKAEVEGKPYTTSSQQWSDPSTQRWAYGYDACDEARSAWKVRRGEQDDELKAVL